MLKDLKAFIENAYLEARRKAKALIEYLKSEDLLAFGLEPEEPPEEIAGVDGSFKSVKAFVRDLTLIRVAGLIYDGNYRVRFYSTSEDRCRSLGSVIVCYRDDLTIDAESVTMLLYEARMAKELSREAFVLIDGPYVNPPADVIVADERLKRNYVIRGDLIKDNVIAFVKRFRTNFLAGLVSEKTSEAIVLKAILDELRDEPTVVIGPFRTMAKTEFFSRGIYARYIRRSRLHKPVLVEYVRDELPGRILDERIRVSDPRARVPNVIQLADELAHINDKEARNAYSIVYMILRKIEYELGASRAEY